MYKQVVNDFEDYAKELRSLKKSKGTISMNIIDTRKYKEKLWKK